MNKLKEFVDANGGRENIRFIITTTELDYMPMSLGLPICLKSSGDPEVKVSYRIPEEPEENDDLYGLESNYKIKLVPDTEENLVRYGRETFYQSDLLTMIERGDIEVKVIA